MDRADDAEGPDKERLVRALDDLFSHAANWRAARDLSRRSLSRFGCKQSFYRQRLVIDGGYTCFGDQECHRFAKTNQNMNHNQINTQSANP